MAGRSCRDTIQGWLGEAGVRVGGDRPWDLEVRDECLFRRVLARGSLGLGEAYMDGWWDCPQLDEFFNRVLRARLDERTRGRGLWTAALRARLFNPQSPLRAARIVRHHYDAGNDLYEAMLDRRMIYSCGYWRRARNLDEAQEAKLDLIFHKLRLEQGMRVLDVGCGWGGAARYAAERYGVEVVGITLSEEQLKRGRRYCAGWPVELLLEDYRRHRGLYDRVFSVGMLEHVGWRNYRVFMRCVRRCLKEDGLFLLHTIGGNRSVRDTDPWIGRYIFPDSMLPSLAQLSAAAEGIFVLEDLHGFGPDYDDTLRAWHQNFESAWEGLKDGYDECFRRMWRYYLLSCVGAFRARRNQVWQMLYSTKGLPVDSLESVR